MLTRKDFIAIADAIIALHKRFDIEKCLALDLIFEMMSVMRHSNPSFNRYKFINYLEQNGVRYEELN